MMMRWWEHSEKSVTEGRTDRKKSPRQINEIHQLNDNQQTHSSKAILDNTLSAYIVVITLCYDIKAHLSG